MNTLLLYASMNVNCTLINVWPDLKDNPYLHLSSTSHGLKQGLQIMFGEQGTAEDELTTDDLSHQYILSNI